jgi:7,8-dihydropterin-6-yl-methyl-4-(beta-D-ribofuranosyl)aminobenzene 5'-phosphate synthase
VIILGCAHRGPINTVRHAQQITGVEQVHTVVGGTHLLRASEERVLITAAAFQEMGARRVGVSHCTGLHSAMLLAQQLGDVFFFNNTGTSITVP